jgi:hypothetical protein
MAKTEKDGTRDYVPVPKNMGELYRLAKIWVDAYGTEKEVELIEWETDKDLKFLSPKP